MQGLHILRTERLSKRFGFGAATVLAIDDVSFAVRDGEIVVVMGPSGSGKTTLLSMMGGLMRPTSGKVFIRDTDISSLSESRLPSIRARNVGFIFQGFNLLEALNVEENVLLPARLAPGGVRGARKRADDLLERLDLTARRAAHPKTLSGGEKQRVAIARALVNRAPLVLADEPTGNLDSQKGHEVTMILHDMARDEGCSVVIVTHDPGIEDIADRVLWLEDGRIRDRRRDTHSWVRDPVCGMRIDEWTAERFAMHHGRRYAFCSQRCLERFEADAGEYTTRDAGAEERQDR